LVNIKINNINEILEEFNNVSPNLEFALEQEQSHSLIFWALQ